MHEKTVLGLLLALSGALTGAHGAPVDPALLYHPDNYRHEFVAGELIVAFKDGAEDFADPGLSSRTGVRSRRKLAGARRPGGGRAFLARKLELLVTGERTREGSLVSLEKLRRDPNVAYVEPNYVLRASALPDDPSFPLLWGLRNTGQTGGTPRADIDATAAWNHTQGNPNLLIGVIDSGIDYLHPDLADNIWTNPGEIPGNGIDDDGNGYVDDVHGFNFVNNTGDPMDDHFHGTYVSGALAATGDNGIGVTGVVWRARLVALKFLDSSGRGTVSAALNAIAYANAMGITLTNNSWGGGGYSQSMKDAIDAGGAKGCLFIAAAGNDGTNNDAAPYYPSSYASDNIISVAATDHNDSLAAFSNYGAAGVDLSAPGVGIYGTSPGNAYVTNSGTSIATPHVTGAAALLWSYNPQLTRIQVKNYLLQGVDPVPGLGGRMVSGGRLNAKKALDWVVPPAITYKIPALIAGVNVAIPPDTAESSGGMITGFAASPPLPPGLVLNTVTGIISGTPTTVSASADYTVSATGPAGSGSAIIRITVVNIPPAPALMAPVTHSVNAPLSPTLAWTAPAGATSYRLQVAADSTFSSVLAVDDSAVINASRAVGPLSTDTKYFWRTRAQNAAGASAWSQIWDFTTVPPVPAAPALTYPGQNAGGVPLSPTLAWNASTGAVFYRVQLSTDSAFLSSSTSLEDSTLVVTFKAVGPLENGGVYYWRVNAANAGGAGPFSAVRKFSTLPSIPAAAPALASPLPNAGDVPLYALLVWDSVSGAADYRLQIATSPSFGASLILDHTAPPTSYTVGPLSGDATYYWRVYARNAGGTGPWSPPWQFTTQGAATLLPGDFTLQTLSALSGTAIRFGLPRPERVRIRLFNSQGRLLSQPLDGVRDAGYYTLSLPKGLKGSFYVLDFQAGNFHRMVKFRP